MTNKKHDPLEVIDRRTKPGQIDPMVANQLPELAEIERTYENPVPIFDRVLIRRNAKETTFAGTHFVIPESAQKSANRGVVVAAAQFYIVEGKSFPVDEIVKPGDVVTFSGFNTEDIELEGETFTLCSVFDLKLIEKVHFALGVS